MNIITEIKSLEEEILKCMRCGFCQAECPLYQKDLLEPSVARAKIFAISQLINGNFKELDKILNLIEYCLLCKRCANACPSGVKTDLIFIKTKSTLRKVIKLPAYQKIPLSFILKNSFLIRFISPFIAKYKPEPVKRKILDKKEYDFVGLYPGCVANYILTSWKDNTIDFLESQGVRVVPLATDICCGIPALTSGEKDLFKYQIMRIKGEIEKFNVSAIITLCPTCQWAISDLSYSIADISIEKPVYDIMQYIRIKELEGYAKIDEKTTLHVPCHYAEKSLLKSIVKERIQTEWISIVNDGCCGFGGIFSTKFKKDSEELFEPKLKELKEKDIHTVITTCPGCAIQFARHKIKIIHPVELLYV